MATSEKAFRDYASVGEILDTVDIYKQVGPSEDKILKQDQVSYDWASS